MGVGGEYVVLSRVCEAVEDEVDEEVGEAYEAGSGTGGGL